MKLQFISKWNNSGFILVCLIAFATQVVAPETKCNNCGVEVQIESNQWEKGAIFARKSSDDQREYVTDENRAKPERLKPLGNSGETFIATAGSSSEVSAKFLFRDETQFASDRKRVGRIKKTVRAKESFSNEFRGSAHNFAEDDDNNGKRKRRSKRGTKGTRNNNEKLIRPAKAANIQSGGQKKSNRRNNAGKSGGKNGYWNKMQAAKTGSKRTGGNLNGQQNGGPPSYPDYGNRQPQPDYGGSNYPAIPQYGEFPNSGANPAAGNPSMGGYPGGGNPSYNYPTPMPFGLTTMLYEFKGRRAKSTPKWRQPVYGVQTQMPGSYDYGMRGGMPNQGGMNQGGTNQQGGMNQGGMNQGGFPNNMPNDGGSNFNPLGSGFGTPPPRRRYPNEGAQGGREDFLPRNGTKVNRIRKRFQYVQLNNPNEILVAWPFANPNPNAGRGVMTVLVTALPMATTKFLPNVNGEVKKPVTTKKPGTTKKTTTPKPTTTTTLPTTTTEMEFTEEMVNGSTKGMAVDINKFEAPSEQPMTMGFNIDEEFTGVIMTDGVTGSRKGKTADDANKFELMQGVLQGIIITSPPPDQSELDDALKDIMAANKNAAAKETTKPANTTTTISANATTPAANSTALLLPNEGNSSVAAVTQPATTTIGLTTPGGTKPMTPAPEIAFGV